MRGHSSSHTPLHLSFMTPIRGCWGMLPTVTRVGMVAIANQLQPDTANRTLGLDCGAGRLQCESSCVSVQCGHDGFVFDGVNRPRLCVGLGGLDRMDHATRKTMSGADYCGTWLRRCKNVSWLNLPPTVLTQRERLGTSAGQHGPFLLSRLAILRRAIAHQVMKTPRLQRQARLKSR